MKMTIRDAIDKLRDIESAINTISKKIPDGAFEGHEPLYDAIALLNEYAEFIRDTKIEI